MPFIEHTEAAPRTTRARSALLLGAVAIVLAVGTSSAPPRTRSARPGTRPRSDAEVVARVAPRKDAAGRALERLERARAARPDDVATALALAQHHLAAARQQGDPRALGAAEAVLAPLARAPSPPTELHLLRATILQARHDFDEALAALGHVLARTPDEPQARLTRASVLTVLGRYTEARGDCEALAPHVGTALRVSCLAPLDARQGRAARARDALTGALAEGAAPLEQALLHSLASEHAYWEGAPERAESHARTTLRIDPSDRYTRALLADLLLDAGRAREVLALLPDEQTGASEDDALALRGTLAALALGSSDAGQRVARLRARFEASRLRGDSVHQREEARLLLALNEPQPALAAAQASWAVQHEPWDARVVLEAALASQRPEAAREVAEWLRETGFEAPRLRRLAARLGGAP